MGDENAALAASANTHTTLTAWMALNAEDAHARQFTYQEIPEHYKWDHKHRRWVRRERQKIASKVIGRIHAATPTDQERFYLYLVLLKAKGPTSWENLKIAHDKPAQTWRQVAEARDLIASDEEYELTLREAPQLLMWMSNSI